MNISKQVIILSAEQTSNSNEKNRQLTENLAACLDDVNLSYNRATGVYKGVEETSFVVLPNDEFDIETLKGFAFTSFGQESVLFQDSNQESYLVFSDGSTEQLGRLEQTTQEIALQRDNFTVMNGEYYVTNKRS